jgi:hypothetical protein
VNVKCALIVAFALGLGSGHAWRPDKPIKLTVEKRITLRVGESAVLQIPSDRRYSHFRGDVGGGNAVAIVRQSGRKVLYRAVQPGNSVIVISPEVPKGECISCATLHYFITVVPDSAPDCRSIKTF